MKNFLEDDGMLDPYADDPKRMIDPDPEDLEEDPDVHSCRANVSIFGHCTICGSTVYGTSAYYEETGSDPPETVRYESAAFLRGGRL